MQKLAQVNQMKKIRVEKIVINVGLARSPEKAEEVAGLVKKITGAKPVVSITKKRNTFGIPKGRPMGVRVTLRGLAAMEFLKRAFKAVESTLKKKSFSGETFSFGVKEYIDIPGMQYDPDVGIIGMDVCVTLQRPGFRVKRRRIRSSSLHSRHRITDDDAVEFIKSTFGIKVD